MLGTYRIVKKLGEGGMGAVYLAEHALLGRRAAVKVLQPALSANQDIVQRFFNEARAATAIADPGIVQIFDFGYHTDGSAYIVMEFLEGEALDARLKRFGRLAPEDALRILRQVAASLHAAHGRGIVHRDLKPENIFLVPDREVAGGERAKILDFGIAKLTNDAGSKVKTQTAAIMGTPVYMSPEQCRGAGYVDHRSDLYSLGCVLYHLLVGRPPFDGEGVGEIIAAHLREPAPVPSALAPGVPPAVDALVARCLAKQPEARFATAAELAETCAALLSAAPSMVGPAPNPGYAAAPTPSVPAVTTLSGAAGAAPTAGATAPAQPRGSKRGLVIALGAVGAVAAGVIAIVVASSGGGDRTAPTAATQPETAVATPVPTPVPTPTEIPPPDPTPTAIPTPTATPTPTDPAVAPTPEPPTTVEPPKKDPPKKDPPKKDPPKKDAPEPGPPADPAALVDAASGAAMAGNYAAARRDAEAALAAGATGAVKAKAATIAALAACRLDDEPGARRTTGWSPGPRGCPWPRPASASASSSRTRPRGPSPPPVRCPTASPRSSPASPAISTATASPINGEGPHGSSSFVPPRPRAHRHRRHRRRPARHAEGRGAVPRGQGPHGQGQVRRGLRGLPGQLPQGPRDLDAAQPRQLPREERPVRQRVGRFIEAERRTRGSNDPAQQAINDLAKERFAALEPRLSYLTVNVPDSSRVDGLVITRDGEPVDAAEWNRSLPEDIGSHVIEGKAPGYEPWRTTVVIAAERETKAVTVPAWTPVPVKVPDPELEVVDTSPFTAKRKLAIGLAGLGVVGVGGGIILYFNANNLQDKAEAEVDDDEQRRLHDDANQRLLFAQIAGGVGVLALGAATYLWLTGKPTVIERSGTTVTLTPTFGPSHSGLSVVGAF
jgi:tRNA A-37 threonylcarbamoyl transferase component Bud32